MIYLTIYLVSLLVMSYAVYREWYQGISFTAKDILIVLLITLVPIMNSVMMLIWLGYTVDEWLDNYNIVIQGRNQNA